MFIKIEVKELNYNFTRLDIIYYYYIIYIYYIIYYILLLYY